MADTLIGVKDFFSVFAVKESRVVVSFLSVVALLCTGIFYFFLAKAGQTGDTKSGLGDPVKALELEDRAFPFLLGAALSIGGICFAIARIPIMARILFAIIVAAFALVGIWFIGGEIETASLGNFTN
ncbi:MAG: hypothetical protein L0Z48_00745 [candidate division Zixibacteria bacterium]|nr:hypothetical protein [candidate division Zixibacteria bacterium]